MPISRDDFNKGTRVDDADVQVLLDAQEVLVFLDEYQSKAFTYSEVAEDLGKLTRDSDMSSRVLVYIRTQGILRGLADAGLVDRKQIGRNLYYSALQRSD